MSEYEKIKEILDSNQITDLDQIEYGSEVYEELFGYYMDSGEMPYGVMKARTGMPDEWIIDRLIDLGFDKPDPVVNHDKHQGREDAHSHLAKHYHWKDMI